MKVALPSQPLHMSCSTKNFVNRPTWPQALSWIALYDILLCVVNGPDGDMIREAILTYPGDLMSVTSSAAAQQVIANRMSAFCCFAGMEIATNKTEYVAINGPRTPPSLHVHGLRWDEVIVPVCMGRTASSILGYLSLSKGMSVSHLRGLTTRCSLRL
jgi:hypothetical protein